MIPLRAFKDNYIWMIQDTISNKVWAVDPGDAAPVKNYLSQNNLVLAGILITHHHYDHSGGVADLIQLEKTIPVYASYKSIIPEVTHPLRENDKINCGSYSFTVLEIPGHTLDHIAFYNEKILLSGDTLFSIGCGKVFEGTAEQMYDSLIKLKKLSDETQVYCGHEYTLSNLKFAEYIEPHNQLIKDKIIEAKSNLAINHTTLPTLLGEEKWLNPFLRCDDPVMKQIVESYFKKNLTHPVAVFSHLRDWKNKFVT